MKTNHIFSLKSLGYWWYYSFLARLRGWFFCLFNNYRMRKVAQGVFLVLHSGAKEQHLTKMCHFSLALGDFFPSYLNFVIFRTNTVKFRTNTVLFRINPVIFRTNLVLARTHQIIFRTNPVILMTNPRICRTNSVILRTRSVICRTNPIILGQIWDKSSNM